jgi:hypothetical protein
MYAICDGLSVTDTMGLCRITAHTWFAAVAHSDEAVRLFDIERGWARKACKPVPELAGDLKSLTRGR